jgi:hypothetical protein
MRLWRCYNCPNDKGVPGRDFMAEPAEPVCPKCSLSGKDPRFGKRIVPLKTVHFDPPHPTVAEAGTGKLACGQAWKADTRATGHAGTVNCPACRVTDEFKKATEAQDPGGDDFEVPGDYQIEENHAA